MFDLVTAHQGLLILFGSGSSLILTAVSLARRPRGMASWSFALGMLAFAVESLAAYMLITMTESPNDRLFWLRAVGITGLSVPLPWALFVTALAYPRGSKRSLSWRLGVALGGALALVASAAVVSFSSFQISGIPERFYAAPLGAVGRYAVIAQLLATVGILAGLEACLRTAKGVSRWRIKYLVLGLGGVFLVRFYLLSNILLFDVLMATYLTTASVTLFVGNIVIGASLARQRLQAMELTVSRTVLYRSVVVGVLGLYLFIVGVLGWALNYLGIPEKIFWGSLGVLVSALGLATLLLSDNARWRIKRFISLNLYRGKYDYRQQWITFTKRLGSLLTVEQLAPQLLGSVTEAVGTAKGVMYLADERDEHYHLAGAVWVGDSPAVLRADSPLVMQLRSRRTFFVFENGEPGSAAPRLDHALVAFGAGSVAVPLHWRSVLIGFMVVGPERTGAPYSPEDLELVGTVAEQAVGAIVTARLSETLARSREFEAFHRLTSFVIHDLKNSISALSMVSQNAIVHFDDPEFQRDSIKTLSRTVERMNALLAKLSFPPESAAFRFDPIDLRALVLEATAGMEGAPRVSIVNHLARVPVVRGDHESLLKVIQNLVANATEAVAGSGEVTLKTYEEQGSVVFSVTDTGCGIPEEFRRKWLFTPFRSTKKGGWGIGLYQAKAIVDGHGGAIEVASREGAGTTFWVRLPAESSPREASDR